MSGITGKILEVNLTDNKINVLKLPKEYYENFLGGTGLAAKIFFDREIYKYEPLSSENLLMFMIGPLTGTTFPGVSRFQVCARSPLTNIWGEASCGADFGKELKLAGYDGIIISGKADEPVYLLIDNDKVEIKSAKELWGKDNYEIYEYFLKLDKKLQVASIGQAGENLVKFAGISTDKGDHAARCGLGAVMGYKKLKAIAVKGNNKVKIEDEKRFNELRKKLIEKIRHDPLTRALNQYGTNSTMLLGAQIGDVPTKNWKVAIWEHAEKIDGVAVTENILIKTKACFGCLVACKRVVKIGEEVGPGPEYETAAALGSLLYNDDLNYIAKANELCNRYGVDTISCGSVIAWAMECVDAGIIDKDSCDDLEIKFGNKEVILKLIEKIAKREGIGDLLAEGVRGASKKLGKGSEKFAIHIHGLEMPMHDPRAYHGLALSYATSSRGACHTHDINLMVEMGVSKYPEISIKGGYDPISSKYKSDLTVKSQNYGQVYSSAVMCYFVASILSAKDVLDMINCVQGWEWDLDKMIKTGERIWYLKRSINYLNGMKKEDEDLPERIKKPYIEGTLPGFEKLVVKMTSIKPPKNPRIRRLINNFIYDKIFPKIKYLVRRLDKLELPGRKRLRKNPFLVVPEFSKMKEEFYNLRSLDNDGKPKRSVLENLGLKEVAEKLF